MDITFRLAAPADLPRLADINSLGDAEEKKEAENALPGFIEKRNLICAEVNGQIVGLLYWAERFLGEENWFITQITIDTLWQRKGVGEALWRFFLSKAKRAGAKYVYCDIKSSNTVSANLAKKVGMVEAGNIDMDGNKRVFYRIKL